jgi:hypothetical protein
MAYRALWPPLILPTGAWDRRFAGRIAQSPCHGVTNLVALLLLQRRAQHGQGFVTAPFGKLLRRGQPRRFQGRLQLELRQHGQRKPTHLIVHLHFPRTRWLRFHEERQRWDPAGCVPLAPSRRSLRRPRPEAGHRTAPRRPQRRRCLLDSQAGPRCVRRPRCPRRPSPEELPHVSRLPCLQPQWSSPPRRSEAAQWPNNGPRPRRRQLVADVESFASALSVCPAPSFPLWRRTWAPCSCHRPRDTSSQQPSSRCLE